MTRVFFLLLLSVAAFANSLTVYNNNLAFVQEERNVTITNGVFRLENLSFDIIDSSILIHHPTLEPISYEFHNAKSFMQAMLKKNLNKEIIFIANKKEKRGKLIQIEPKVVVEDSNKSYYIIHSLDSIIFKELAKKYPKRPYLKVKVDSLTNTKTTIKLSYLMRNLSWKSSYIINLAKERLQLEAFIDINNNSEQSFQNYNFNFVAGKLHQTSNYRTLNKTILLESAPTAKIERSKLAEYYLYSLPYKESILKKTKKFFKLFTIKDIPYKSYYQTNSSFFTRYSHKLNFFRIVEFENKKTLNQPLPAGKVRLYTNGLYIGEDYINNTPQDALVKLQTGIAFDIKGEKKVLEYSENKNYKKQTIQYTITNSSQEPKAVRIREKIPRVSSKELSFKSSCKKPCSIHKIDAFNKEYRVELAAQSSYSFQVTYEILY